MHDAKDRAGELKKLQAFADVNDLTMELAATKGVVYEGRMGVHTQHYSAQHVGGRKLVVHEKSLVGQDLPPGQDLRIDYRGRSPVVKHMGPTKSRGIGR